MLRGGVLPGDPMTPGSGELRWHQGLGQSQGDGCWPLPGTSSQLCCAPLKSPRVNSSLQRLGDHHPCLTQALGRGGSRGGYDGKAQAGKFEEGAFNVKLRAPSLTLYLTGPVSLFQLLWSHLEAQAAEVYLARFRRLG